MTIALALFYRAYYPIPLSSYPYNIVLLSFCLWFLTLRGYRLTDNTFHRSLLLVLLEFLFFLLVLMSYSLYIFW